MMINKEDEPKKLHKCHWYGKISEHCLWKWYCIENPFGELVIQDPNLYEMKVNVCPICGYKSKVG